MGLLNLSEKTCRNFSTSEDHRDATQLYLLLHGSFFAGGDRRSAGNDLG